MFIKNVGAHAKRTTLIQFNFDKYKIIVEIGKEPTIFEMWLKHASFKDIEGLAKDGTPIYIGVGHGKEWYNSIIAFRSDPIDHAGFHPEFLILPETNTLFVGAGTVVKPYDLEGLKKKFEKELSLGFWGWTRHNDLIVMQEELELGVYTLDGQEIWSTFVQPPWTFEITGNEVKLNVMGEITYRDLKTGELKK